MRQGEEARRRRKQMLPTWVFVSSDPPPAHDEEMPPSIHGVVEGKREEERDGEGEERTRGRLLRARHPAE